MPRDWESHLERWNSAGLLDAATTGRIRSWESARTRTQGLRWQVLIALAFGAVLLAAGILLFVSAHWDELSPGQRMAVVLAMVGGFHLGAAWAAERFEALSIALHTIGTVSLGAGIALAGQIYNLAERWPAAVLLWASGAVSAWALLRQWPQAALAGILLPYWLAGEWWVWMADRRLYFEAPISAGICALSLTYLSARRVKSDSALRKALAWIGGIALLPAAAAAAVETWTRPPAWQIQAIGWAPAALVPLGVAFLLRRRVSVWNAAAIVWSVLLPLMNGGKGDTALVYFWCALGAIGLAAWGVLEARTERINLGIAGFAITVLAFYFSNVMDKLGRSASLIVMGLLFLGGGWFLEKLRRRLLARVRPEAS